MYIPAHHIIPTPYIISMNADYPVNQTRHKAFSGLLLLSARRVKTLNGYRVNSALERGECWY